MLTKILSQAPSKHSANISPFLLLSFNSFLPFPLFSSFPYFLAIFPKIKSLPYHNQNHGRHLEQEHKNKSKILQQMGFEPQTINTLHTPLSTFTNRLLVLAICTLISLSLDATYLLSLKCLNTKNLLRPNSTPSLLRTPKHTQLTFLTSLTHDVK